MVELFTALSRPWRRAIACCLLAAVPVAGSARDPSAEPPEAYLAWLNEVEPLISEAESAVFAGLRHDYQRDLFTEAFWQQRQGFRQSWEQRRQLALELYGELEGDRSRAMLLLGPPETILADLCPELVRPLEAWRYGRGWIFSNHIRIAPGESN
jgi:AcrR family transcriptional regulator